MERRRNQTLRESFDNIYALIEDLNQKNLVSEEKLQSYKEDLDSILSAVTNYHSRFTELLETLKTIKSVEANPLDNPLD
jgi:uncharacterized coiled-coil DUF342 family protein